MADDLKKYREEYIEHGREVMISGMKLKAPEDRVRLCQWLRKLAETRSDDPTGLHRRNEYMQFLRVMLQGNYHVLTKPFNNPPPDDLLVPLAECLANKCADAIPDTPRSGQMQPTLCHRSADDRAFMCIKQTVDGVFCYMAVVPDANSFTPPR